MFCTGMYPEFLGQAGTSSKLMKGPPWLWVVLFSKFVPLDAPKMDFLALSVLRFLCKIFSKLFKFTLRNGPLCY